MMDDRRRTVLVTGGTRGIGRAVVDLLAPTWHVWVGGRDADAVAAVVDECPQASPFVADLTDAGSTRAAAAFLDSLDAVVHSAGVVSWGASADQTRDEWHRVMELNVIAVSDLTALLLPRLRSAQGQVVTINSGAGLSAGANNGIYAASKFALRAWADALRAEERGAVRVTSVFPGRVDTDMQHEMVDLMGGTYAAQEYLRPESVARAVVTALEASPEACVEAISVRPSGWGR